MRALMGRSRLIALAVIAAGCHGPALPAVPGKGGPTTSTGDEKIDLGLNDVDIYDALRAIAMKARIDLFVDPDLTGNVTINVRSTAWGEALATIAKDHALRVEPLRVNRASAVSLWISKESSPAAPRTDFTGEPIGANFDDTPIRSAARTLSALAKVNVGVDDDVQASITLHFRKIPWDLALYHLAQKYELRIVDGSNGIRIARPEPPPGVR